MVGTTYNGRMSYFVSAHPARPVKTPFSQYCALGYAGILTGVLVAQLFTLDEVLELFSSFSVALPPFIVAAFVPCVIVAELCALPFLLRMKLSHAFRWLSMGCSWLVALLWGGLGVALVVAGEASVSVGLFGTVVSPLSAGVSVVIALLFGGMAAVSSWGLWPELPRRRHA